MVAIHGLGGHPHSTWMATNDRGEEKLWLRDFLPDDLPKARIMTFGYSSDLGFMHSKSDISIQALCLLQMLREVRRGNEKVCH